MSLKESKLDITAIRFHAYFMMIHVIDQTTMKKIKLDLENKFLFAKFSNEIEYTYNMLKHSRSLKSNVSNSLKYINFFLHQNLTNKTNECNQNTRSIATVETMNQDWRCFYIITVFVTIVVFIVLIMMQ
ncbi:hypothetical protein SSS_09643 [Sarcoptes scabiei]|nr:hypothetical protein SSS_09643 [Sarcoptes scabiei]